VFRVAPRPNSMRLYIHIVLWILSAAPWPALGAYRCLDYGVVSLSGVIVRQTYPGPPDYRSLTKGDEPRIVWVLLLDERVCVAGSDSQYPAEYYQREVQLVLSADQYAQYRNLLGKSVVATGKLIHGGARYEKRLVLIASEIG
jgi:hypothetical protein